VRDTPSATRLRTHGKEYRKTPEGAEDLRRINIQTGVVKRWRDAKVSERILADVLGAELSSEDLKLAFTGSEGDPAAEEVQVYRNTSANSSGSVGGLASTQVSVSTEVVPAIIPKGRNSRALSGLNLGSILTDKSRSKTADGTPSKRARIDASALEAPNADARSDTSADSLMDATMTTDSNQL